jgi:hypothetical protein
VSTSRWLAQDWLGHTKVYSSLGNIPEKEGEERRKRLALTCFEMTSGESGVSFETSMSTFGAISSSSSSSESDSSLFFLDLSSLVILVVCLVRSKS